MTSRVLIADDSLTIQKVIGITLASSGYELVECLNEEDLFRKTQSNHFDLILLDFNLSDSRSGYELAKQINHIVPGAAIIVMLGTFDTIDESQFESCGISDKIVKPFESSKFIKKCRDLLEGVRPNPTPVKKAAPESIGSFDFDDDSSDLDMWQVDAPIITSREEEEGPVEMSSTNFDPLASEIEGWGFTPNNHLEEKFQKSFPPLIEDDQPETNILERLQSSSLFVLDETTEDDEDATDPAFEIPEDLNRNLLEELDSEISPEAFWAVDEVVPVKAEEEHYILETNLDEVTADLIETVQTFNERESNTYLEATPKTDTTKITSLDHDKIVEKLKVALKPMIEEMVKEFCRQNAEKVAWEVIPDLAENLIRKEIKEISDSIKH